MRERLIVTDIAAVDAGVSIAGYTSDGGRAVRPVLPTGAGIPWSFLLDADGIPIEPFTEIEISLGKPVSRPPHWEDQGIEGDGDIRIIRRLAPEEHLHLLRETCGDSLGAIFGSEIIRRRFVRPGTGSASLGTIRTKEIGFVNLDADKQLRRDRYDLEFRDEQGTRYSLRVTDLAFREFCRRIRNRFTGRRDLAAVRVRERLNSAEDIYLRVGLARPFPHRTGPDTRCYLTITGVYTFPSYLDGRWADYFPLPKRRAQTAGAVMPAGLPSNAQHAERAGQQRQMAIAGYAERADD